MIVTPTVHFRTCPFCNAPPTLQLREGEHTTHPQTGSKQFYSIACLKELLPEITGCGYNFSGWTEQDVADKWNRRDGEQSAAPYIEALTPDGGTKAAYMGEFWFGNQKFKKFVPWDTIKEIMAAIKARAERE